MEARFGSTEHPLVICKQRIRRGEEHETCAEEGWALRPDPVRLIARGVGASGK